MAIKYLYNSKHKKVVIDTTTGVKKEIILDQKHRESVAKGVHLQPRGKDEREFFDRNRQLKKLPTGEIINIQETERLKKEHNEIARDEAKGKFEKEKKERFEKFGAARKWK